MDALLEKRLFWLEKFLRNSASFRHYLNENTSVAEIQLFESNRHNLLKIIRELDQKILDAQKYLPEKLEYYPAPLRDKIHFYHHEKERILKAVGKEDAEILALLEKMYHKDEKKLRALAKGLSVLSKYRNQEREPDRLDKKL